MDETTLSLLDKPLDSLTLRDSLKINAVVFAATVGVGLVYVGGLAAYGKFQDRKFKRENETVNDA